MLMSGAVLSTLTPVISAPAVLPARSVQVPAADWSAPWSRTDVPPASVTPERASVQVQVTVTSPLFQPAALAAGAALDHDDRVGRCRRRCR